MTFFFHVEFGSLEISTQNSRRACLDEGRPLIYHPKLAKEYFVLSLVNICENEPIRTRPVKFFDGKYVNKYSCYTTIIVLLHTGTIYTLRELKDAEFIFDIVFPIDIYEISAHFTCVLHYT